MYKEQYGEYAYWCYGVMGSVTGTPKKLAPGLHTKVLGPG